LESQLNDADLDADVQQALLLQLVGLTHESWNKTIATYDDEGGDLKGSQGSSLLMTVLNTIITGKGASNVSRVTSPRGTSATLEITLPRGMSPRGTSSTLGSFSISVEAPRSPSKFLAIPCSPSKSVIPVLENILAEIDEGREGSVTWQFDMFVLAEVCCGHQLSVLTYYFLSQTGLLRRLNLSAPNLLW
jgi:hypothetical protein